MVLSRLGYVLGFIWLLPATVLIWLGYVLPCWALDWIQYVRVADGAMQFRLLQTHGWYGRAWQRWSAWSGPCCIIYNEKRLTPTILAHELRHCRQQLVFGVFFYLMYAACWLVLRLRYGSAIEAYRRNPFEVDARRAAAR